MTDNNDTFPEKQKAWLAIRRGVPSKALRLDDNVAVSSKLQEGEVLVKVQAAALNHIDYMLLGLLPNAFVGRPHVISHDFAGTVVSSRDSKIKEGEEVFGAILAPTQHKTGQGALAQYVRVPAKFVAQRPQNITPTQAAGIPLVALTAYQVLFEIAKLEPEQSLFVNGGSTAVGLAAIQVAKALGCKVTATASGKNEELVKSLGTDVFIDYTKTPANEILQRDPPSPKFHAILDAVGNIDLHLWTHSEAYLAPDGIFVSVGPRPSGAGDLPLLVRYAWEAFLRPTWLGGVKRKWRMVQVKENQEHLEYIAKLISEGKFKFVVDSVYEFDDVPKAFEHLMTRRARGKVVIKVDPNVA